MKIYRITRTASIANDPKVIEIAKRVRAREVKSNNDEYLREMCKPVSEALAREYMSEGYNAAQVVEGTFEIDNPKKEYVQNVKFDTPEDIESAKKNQLHYWVDMNGTIIDLTASQFNDELNSPLPHIVIGSMSSLKRYRVMQYYD